MHLGGVDRRVCSSAVRAIGEEKGKSLDLTDATAEKWSVEASVGQGEAQ